MSWRVGIMCPQTLMSVKNHSVVMICLFSIGLCVCFILGGKLTLRAHDLSSAVLCTERKIDENQCMS